MNKSDVEDRLKRLTETRRQLPDAHGAHKRPEEQGVSTAWLAETFHLDESVVKARLKNCPALSVKRRGTTMLSVRYDIATAASFLVRPVVSTLDYMRALKRNQLPPALQQTIWDALLKRQKWEAEAKQLYHTEDIRRVLGNTFQSMKFTMQLWVDTLERQTGLTDDQRKLIMALVDELQNDLYEKLVSNLGPENIGPQIEDLPELIGENISVEEVIARVEDPDDGIEELI